MREANPNTQSIFLMLALIAAVEIFRPAPAMAQEAEATSFK
jgi:hypothetical protein